MTAYIPYVGRAWVEHVDISVLNENGSGILRWEGGREGDGGRGKEVERESEKEREGKEERESERGRERER